MNDAEYQDGKVKAVVAYLRSMDNQIDSDGTTKTATYQLQQWRNLDLNVEPQDYNEKWKLEPLRLDTATTGQQVRAPRPSSAPNSFTFKINKAKFAGAQETPPTTYRYKVISLEKLETKLHLMGAWPETGGPMYAHIEDDLPNEQVFQDLGLSRSDPTFDDSPIVAEGTFDPTAGEISISISPLQYAEQAPYWDPDNPGTISMNDFVVCIKEYSPEW